VATPIYEFVQTWLDENDINGSSLFRKAGLSNALFTQMKRGSSPTQKTIRALAEAMSIGRGWLFLHAGYIDEEDLIVQDTDPEIEKVITLWKQVRSGSSQNRDLVMQVLETSASYAMKEGSQFSEDYVDV